jgi:activator of HSP90 ATPase
LSPLNHIYDSRDTQASVDFRPRAHSALGSPPSDDELPLIMPRRVRTITQKVVVHAPPDEVYAAFVNPRKHAAFTNSPATGSARVGGTFTAWDGCISGVPRQLVKGKKIVQEWQTTEWPEGAEPSRLELTFTAAKGGTEIHMAHSNVPAEQAESYRRGWKDYYWTPLKTYFSKQNG